MWIWAYLDTNWRCWTPAGLRRTISSPFIEKYARGLCRPSLFGSFFSLMEPSPLRPPALPSTFFNITGFNFLYHPPCRKKKGLLS